MDTSLFFLINRDIQNSAFDLIMPFITSKPYILFLILIIPVFLKDWKRGLLAVALSLVAFGAADASANILKHIFGRARPCQSLDGVRLLVGCGGSFSMPSSHAVNAFAIAATFSHFFKRLWMPMFIVAAAVAFSRIYVGVHYPSDVIAGAAWGGIVAGIIIMVYDSSERKEGRPYRAILLALLLVFSLFRYYYIVTGPLDLSPDEAHYWEWSRRLDLSYYSKGPMIAYLIAAMTSLMGDTVIAIRFLAPLFLAIASILLYRLTMELFPADVGAGRKAFVAALLLQITPLFATYGVVMTIDSPLIFFWTLSLYLFWRAVKQGRPVYWVLLGISIGLGLLTKYTMAFFYLCAFLFMIFHRQQRRWLRAKGPYLAFVISLLIFSPVILWNATHDWVTLKHTAGQAHIAEGLRISLRDFFEFIGSQIGVISPLLFPVVIYGAFKNRSSLFTDQNMRFLFWFWVPVLGFFILKSLQGKVQANWAMPAYITAFIASVDYFLGRDRLRKGSILLGTASLIALCLTIVAHYSSVLNLPVKMDPTSRLKGWEELGEKVEGIYQEMKSSGKVFVFSDRYQVSSELAFYMPSRPRVYNVNLGRRMNQYDIWGGLEDLNGSDAIFVTIGNADFPDTLREVFDSYEKELFTVYRKDREVLREYSIFRCYNFKGMPHQKGFDSY